MFKGIADKNMKLFYDNAMQEFDLLHFISSFIMTYSIWKISALNSNCRSSNSVMPNFVISMLRGPSGYLGNAVNGWDFSLLLNQNFILI